MRQQAFLITLVSVLFISTSYAQGKLDIEAIKEGVKTSADEFTELRAMLRDDNEDIRLATFDAMVGHGDPSLYELATSTAIVDVNPVIRSRALWEILSRKEMLVISVDPEGTVKEDHKKALDEAYKGDINWNITSVIPEKMCINFYGNDNCYPEYNAQVSGLLLSVSNKYTKGKLRLDTDGTLRGTLYTNSLDSFPVAIELR